jgi:flagellar protein FlaG
MKQRRNHHSISQGGEKMALESIGNVKTVQAQPVQKKEAPKATPHSNPETNEITKPVSVEAAIYLDNATSTIAKPEKKDQNEQGSAKDQGNTSTEQLKKAVDTINKTLPNSEVAFGVHEKTNRITIKIIDKETKEVIKELPPEKTLDMIAKAWELAGLLVDERL